MEPTLFRAWRSHLQDGGPRCLEPPNHGPAGLLSHLNGWDARLSIMDGFRPDADYAEAIARTMPALVILAIGSPRQEVVAARIAGTESNPMVVVNGGAIADFLAERFDRAPPWM